AYNGNSNTNRLPTGFAPKAGVLNPATPAIVTNVSSGSVTVGVSISDSATVSGGYNPSGTVTFNLYDNPTGSGTPLFTDANEPLSGGVANSGSYTTTATGTRYWVATYNGDSNNNSVSSGVAEEAVVVNPATPAIVTNVSRSEERGGGEKSDSATAPG